MAPYHSGQSKGEESSPSVPGAVGVSCQALLRVTSVSQAPGCLFTADASKYSDKRLACFGP